MRVWTSDPNNHTWLEEFICPHFQSVDDISYDCQIDLIEDTEQYEETLSWGAYPDKALVPCFAMDSKEICLPSWYSLGDDLILFQENFNVFYMLNRAINKISVLSPPNNKKSRLALMRVIRELAMNQCLQNNGLFLHGSAFSVEGKGIIIAGPKGAGKTTLLIYALRHKLSQYLSNDRVWVSFINGEIVFRGMPTIAAILPSTLELFPDLKHRLLSSYFDSCLTQNEAKQLQVVPQPRRNGKYSLSPSQFCNILQVASVAEAQGWAVVFPKITHTRGNMEFKQLSPSAASEQLAGALLGSYSQRGQAPVFALSDANISFSQETLNALCQNIASHLSCYECYLGTEAYQNIYDANNFVEYFLR